MHGPYDSMKKKFNLSVVEFGSSRWSLLRNATASTSFRYVVTEVCVSCALTRGNAPSLCKYVRDRERRDTFSHAWQLVLQKRCVGCVCKLPSAMSAAMKGPSITPHQALAENRY